MYVARLFALASLAAALVGCTIRTDEMLWGDTSFDGAPYMQEGNVTGRLAGDMPQVGTFDEPNGYGFYFKDAGFFQFELNAEGDYGWAMVAVYGMVDEDGEVILDETSVIGCTGPDTWVADFDEPATDAEIVLETVEIDGITVDRITIDAEWDNGLATAVAEIPHDI